MSTLAAQLDRVSRLYQAEGRKDALRVVRVLRIAPPVPLRGSGIEVDDPVYMQGVADTLRAIEEALK